MMWLKRACTALYGTHELDLIHKYCYCQNGSSHMAFKVRILYDRYPGITLKGHQNPRKQRVWCLKLSRLRT